MKSLRAIVLSLSALLSLSNRALAANLSPGVRCAIQRVGPSLWMSAYQDSRKLYDFRVGAGGTLDKFFNARGQSLLGPSTLNTTDKVIQWVSFSFNGEVSVSVPGPNRFNINQAGNVANRFAPIYDVRVDRTNCRVEVYSAPQDQWKPQFDSLMSGKYAAYVSYEIQADGEIAVERKILINSFGSVPVIHDFLLQAWNPLNGSKFNAGTVLLRADGSPQSPSLLNAGQAAWVDVTSNTRGYAVAYDRRHPTTSEAMGIVFDKASLNCSNCLAGPSVLFRNFQGENVFAMNLNAGVQAVTVGQSIEQQFYLVPAPGLNARMASRLEALAARLNATSQGPNRAAFSPARAAIVSPAEVDFTLQWISGTPGGWRTGALGEWIQ